MSYAFFYFSLAFKSLCMLRINQSISQPCTYSCLINHCNLLLLLLHHRVGARHLTGLFTKWVKSWILCGQYELLGCHIVKLILIPDYELSLNHIKSLKVLEIRMQVRGSKKARVPCWPSIGQQVLHQRWIYGIHCTQMKKHVSKGSTLPVKPRENITSSPKTEVSVAPQKEKCPPKNCLHSKLLGVDGFYPWTLVSKTSHVLPVYCVIRLHYPCYQYDVYIFRWRKYSSVNFREPLG